MSHYFIKGSLYVSKLILVDLFELLFLFVGKCLHNSLVSNTRDCVSHALDQSGDTLCLRSVFLVVNVLVVLKLLSIRIQENLQLLCAEHLWFVFELSQKPFKPITAYPQVLFVPHELVLNVGPCTILANAGNEY